MTQIPFIPMDDGIHDRWLILIRWRSDQGTIAIVCLSAMMALLPCKSMFAAESPARLAIELSAAAEGQAHVSVDASPGTFYRLHESQDLQLWTIRQDGCGPRRRGGIFHWHRWNLCGVFFVWKPSQSIRWSRWYGSSPEHS